MTLAGPHLRPIIDWWAGSVTHGDLIWLVCAVVAWALFAYGGRRARDIWIERIRVKKRPGDRMEVRIVGDASQVEAAMRAWIERGKHDGSGV